METKESKIFRLAEIIARSLREELSETERMMLEEWLAQDERHRTLYDSFGQEKTLAEQLQLHQHIDWEGDCRQKDYCHLKASLSIRVSSRSASVI